MSRIIGAVLLVVGAILLVFGWNAHESVASEVSEAVTGNPTDESLWYFVIGAGLAVAGLVLVLRDFRRT